MKKKMRIQLLSEEGIPQSDRLVDQTTEFYQGPREPHKGIIKIEFCIQDKTDVQNSIEYLKKLSGDLPIRKKVKRKTNNTQIDDKSDRDNIIESLTEFEDQDVLISTLRNKGFVFLMGEHLKELFPQLEINSRTLDKYQWFIKCTKLAKDPANDKFDPQLLIGIKILEGRSDKVICYFYGNRQQMKIPVPDKPITFKQTNLTKFPHYMQYDERQKWAKEHRILMNNLDKKPSKMYLRWEKDVKLPKELIIHRNVK